MAILCSYHRLILKNIRKNLKILCRCFSRSVYLSNTSPATPASSITRLLLPFIPLPSISLRPHCLIRHRLYFPFFHFFLTFFRVTSDRSLTTHPLRSFCYLFPSAFPISLRPCCVFRHRLPFLFFAFFFPLIQKAPRLQALVTSSIILIVPPCIASFLAIHCVFFHPSHFFFIPSLAFHSELMHSPVSCCHSCRRVLILCVILWFYSVISPHTSLLYTLLSVCKYFCLILPNLLR